ALPISPASNAGDSSAARESLDAALLDLLFDTAQPDDAALPDTGIGLDLERRLAPIFVMPLSVKGDSYGTRASTLAYAQGGELVLRERRYDAQAKPSGESALVVRIAP